MLVHLNNEWTGLDDVVTLDNLPRHVGLIMDGNGRWAKAHGLPRNIGHRQGAAAFEKIVRHAAKIGLEYITVYAFSTENWSRPPEEVSGIMNLLRSYLKDAEKYSRDNIRLRVLGEKAGLDEDIQADIIKIEEKSRDNTGLNLNIALNYGGRQELLHAVRQIAEDISAGKITPESINEDAFSERLYTAGQPEVDLIIRTSGEQRVSNFMLWQGYYAELVFPQVLFPDFKPEHFDAALEEYATRNRRMGGL